MIIDVGNCGFFPKEKYLLTKPTVGDNIKGDWLFMTKQDKENLQNKKLTDSLLFSCLAACESVISKNAYLEKKWCHDCKDYGEYYATRLE